MNKKNVGGKKERKVMLDGLSIGNIVFMYVNDMPNSNISDYMKLFGNFIFAEI